MTLRWRQRSPLSVVLALVITSVIAVTLGISGASLAHEADGHPARIHEGTCDALGPVADQLTGVGADMSVEGTPVATPEPVGSIEVIPSQVSTTELETETSHFTGEAHAIVVYESDEAMDTALVCGNIGGALLMQMPGMPMPGDGLVIWLAPQGDADYTGVALVRSEVGGKSTVTIILAQGLTGGSVADHDDEHATPEATPTSG